MEKKRDWLSKADEDDSFSPNPRSNKLDCLTPQDLVCCVCSIVSLRYLQFLIVVWKKRDWLSKADEDDSFSPLG